MRNSYFRSRGEPLNRRPDSQPTAGSRSEGTLVLEAVLSTLPGVVVGITTGFYGPVLVAVMRGDDPIHADAYGDWITGLLMVALPIILGVALTALSLGDRWRRGLHACWFIALVLVDWQAYLVIT